MWEDKIQDKIFQDKPRDMEMKELKEAANLTLLFQDPSVSLQASGYTKNKMAHF